VNVYSTLFVQGAVPTTPAVFFTVPSGYVAVVRDVDAVASSVGLELYISDAILNQNFAAILPVVGPTVNAYTWRGRQVFLPGGEMQWGTAFDLMFGRVSGYLLSA
jgi:hypothetical protein